MVWPHSSRAAEAAPSRNTYDAQARERILAEARRAPDPEQDGMAIWSFMTLRLALAPCALWPAPCQHLHDWLGAACLRLSLAGRAQLVRDVPGGEKAPRRHGKSHGPQ
jgi:hypothetical protein